MGDCSHRCNWRLSSEPSLHLTSLKHDEDVHHAFLGIEIDHLPESGYVEKLIEDNYLSPFPLVQSTERPDRVISGLMEGRVAILLDGKPFVLLVPVTFSMVLQSPEDYDERWFPSSLIRLWNG